MWKFNSYAAEYLSASLVSYCFGKTWARPLAPAPGNVLSVIIIAEAVFLSGDAAYYILEDIYVPNKPCK